LSRGQPLAHPHRINRALHAIAAGVGVDQFDPIDDDGQRCQPFGFLFSLY
jgi:hypothetical protein